MTREGTLAAEKNFIIDAGASWQQKCVWKKNGVVVPLTGYTARLSLKRNYNDTNPVLTLTSPSGGITLDVTNGCFYLALTNAQSTALQDPTGVPASYYYDLLMTDGSGFVSKPVRGTFTVMPGVTS